MRTSRELAALLRRLAAHVETLPDHESANLLYGAAHPAAETRQSTSKQRPKSKVRSLDPQVVADALATAATRADATAILEREGVSKVVLEKLARRFDLPVLRSDPVDRLRQRIVEHAVGFRINSDAIRRTDRR